MNRFDATAEIRQLVGNPLLLDPRIAPLMTRDNLNGLIDTLMALPDDMERREFNIRQKNGVAVLTIAGTLFGFLYDFHSRQLEMLLEDASIRAIILEMRTPGGVVPGAFELAEQVFEGRSIKPIVMVASHVAASAGYLVGSAANEVVVTQSGVVGSVGVLFVHTDFEKLLADEGIGVELLFAGERKVDGNPFHPLSPEARTQIQSGIDKTHNKFTSAVALHRGLDQQAVIDTQAAIFRGDDAVTVGFADRVGTVRGELDRLLAANPGADSRLFSISQTRGNSTMTTQVNTGGESPAAPTLTQADVDSAVQAAVQTAVANALNEERERMAAIMDHDAAKGRETLARKLASTPSLSAEDAIGILEASPKETTQIAQVSDFEQRLTAEGNPEVGSDPEPENEEQAHASTVARLVSYSKRGK